MSPARAPTTLPPRVPTGLTPPDGLTRIDSAISSDSKRQFLPDGVPAHRDEPLSAHLLGSMPPFEDHRSLCHRFAGELFAEQGYVQTTVAGIAERAQVAVNTVYPSGRPGRGSRSHLRPAPISGTPGDRR